MKNANQLLTKHIYYLSGLLSLIFIIAGCNKQAEFAATNKTLQSAIQQDIGEELKGNIYVKVTGNNEVLILQSGHHPDTIDQITLLAADKKTKLDIEEGDLGYSTLFYYKDKRGIVLHTGSENRIYFLGLAEAASSKKVELIKTNRGLNGEIQASLLGYGLSVLKGKWDTKTLIGADKKYALNLLTLADLRGKTTPAARQAATMDDPPFTCTSGGPNSTSCSITEVMGIACSVTCSEGYYSCCNSNTTRCICVRNGFQPGPVALYQQCGGENWTGPTQCVSGALCVIVNPYFSQCLPA